MDNDILAPQLTTANELDSSDHLLDSAWESTSSPPLPPPSSHDLMATSPSSINTTTNHPSNINSPTSGGPASSNIKNKKLFPQKLWDLINDNKYHFCLRWSEDGQLVYLDRDNFEGLYLKTAENQFHTQKAISFVRQMNMYGFRKVDDCYYENDNFKRDCEYLLKNMIRKHPNKNPTNPTEITPYKAELRSETELSNSFHSRTDQSAYIAGDSPIYGSFNMNLKTANANALSSANLDTTNITDLSSLNQQHDFHSLCNDQKELIKALMAQQQTDTQYPRDLTTASSKTNNHYLNYQQSDNNNLNTFYALLSSLNSNLYQPQTQLQAHQNMTLDMSRYLQSIYQQILTTSTSTPTPSPTITAPNANNARIDRPFSPNVPVNYGFNSTFVTQKSLIQQQSSTSTKNMDGLALHNSASDKEPLSTSLLARNKFSATATRSSRSLEMLENGYRKGSQIEERSHELIKDNKQQAHYDCNFTSKPISDPESLAAKRRDIKLSTINRSFKRSVDSILDSNNNNNGNNCLEHRESSNAYKRIKVEIDSEESTDAGLVDSEVLNQYAKNLVAQVALSRDTCIDPSVIAEASRFALRFVETLFDTAQVIARHSNNSSSASDTVLANNTCQASSREETDSKSTRDVERSSAINLNDLTSALKLLPSKISKLLN